MERYYQPEIECASREQILAWQNERLLKQVRNVWDNVPYYRKKMEAKGVTPEDIKSVDDLYKLPFLTKDDLREAYPYGLVARAAAGLRAHPVHLAAPRASGWWHSTPSMTLTCGKTAAHGPLWPRAAPMRMCARCATATACSPAALA